MTLLEQIQVIMGPTLLEEHRRMHRLKYENITLLNAVSRYFIKRGRTASFNTETAFLTVNDTTILYVIQEDSEFVWEITPEQKAMILLMDLGEYQSER